MTITGYLVWLPGLRGYVAQKWPAGFVRPHDMPEPVARFPLGPAEYRLTIAILEQRYAPPPETPVKPESAPS